MEFAQEDGREAAEFVALFENTFTDSEGAEEGRLIGRLVARMLEAPDSAELLVFTAREDGALAGCIVFSRLAFAEDPRTVLLLAPVAVATDRQGKGVGQGLLRHGLDALRRRGVDVAVTYGDPNYYGKVGFRQVTEAVLPAPLPLNQPEGWLAQSLTDRPLDPFTGASRCVAALDDPAYW